MGMDFMMWNIYIYMYIYRVVKMFISSTNFRIYDIIYETIYWLKCTLDWRFWFAAGCVQNFIVKL